MAPNASITTLAPARPDPVLGRLGGLEVRLARTAREIEQAQRLRFRVFYEEMSAKPGPMVRDGRDTDPYDADCDHLLVVDHEAGAAVVGTYRLLRQDRMSPERGFYTGIEFEVEELVARKPGLRFLELGRSCVLKPYRTKRTVELLWHGIWSYVLHHRMDVMFGCACIEGTDPQKLALPLSFLHHYARAPEPWRGRARSERFTPMDLLPKEGVDARRALHALPPLIKGYLRAGAIFGDGAVVDPDFGTTDVLVILPVTAINARYINHFGQEAERHAA